MNIRYPIYEGVYRILTRDRCRPAGGEDPLFAAEPGGGEAAWAERTRAICGEIFLGGVWQEYVGVL